MFHHRYLFFSPLSKRLADLLVTASSNGHDTIVSNLLRRGADPDIYTPLHTACQYNHPHMAVSLIQWGADLRRRYVNGWTPLHWACDSNALACVKMLLEHHSPTGEPDCVCS